MKENIEVLTFDTESATQLSLIRNLGEEKIRITLASYKRNGLNRLSKYVNNIIKISNWNEQSDVFVNELTQFGEKKPLKYMIIATDDKINLLLARNYEVVSKYFFLPFNDDIKILIDKEHFYSEMKKQQVEIPETYISNSKEELSEYVKSLGFPLIIKPKCMFDYDFHKHFNNKILKIFNQKQYKNLENKILQIFDKIIIQRLIGGDKNMAVYGYYDRNKFQSYCMIDKDAMSSWGTTIIGHYIEDIDFGMYAESILKKLNYIGFAELEFIYDSKNKIFKLLEINTRPVQWCRLCSKTKNSIEAIPIQMLNGNFNCNIGKVTSIKEKYIFYEMGLIELFEAGKISLKDIYKYIKNPQYVSMYWDNKDLIPSIRYRLSFTKALLKTVINRLLAKFKKGFGNYEN